MKTLIQTLFFFLLTAQICFAQWFPQSSGTTNDLYSVFFTDSNTGWTVGGNGIILRTTDGGNNWTSQNSGTTNSLYSVYFVDSDNGWVVGGVGKILNTTNGGDNWISQSSGTTSDLHSVYFTDLNTGWVVGGNGTILKTTDGNNWISQYSGITHDIASVYFTNSDTGWTVGGEYILKTTDGGNNWIQLFGGMATFSSVYFIDSDTGWVVYSAVRPGSGNISKTADGGNSWTIQWSSGTQALFSVYFIDSNSGWVVGGGGKILNTANGGDNWIFQNSGTTNSLYSVFFTDSNTGWIVGTAGTLLKTTNGGVPVELTAFTATSKGNEVILNWSTATETNNKGFSIERKAANSEYSEIGFVPGFGTTTEPKSYTFTDSKVSTGKYTYRLKQTDFDGSYKYSQEVEAEVSAPLAFSLEQNYPNPFNPSTKIRYTVPQGSQIQIKVFDVLGSELATLVNEYKQAGRYELDYNAVSLPSGVYFYQLRAGSIVETRKMILLK
jgi:photosystem II stability/assembly factor-like uncharacterized protein